jgi:hypothetical protein
MNSDCSSESTNDISNIIDTLKQKNYFNYVNSDNKNLIRILTSTIIPDNIKFIGNIIDSDLQIWLETKHNILLCGIKNAPIKSWYKIKSDADIKILKDSLTSTDKTYIFTSRFLLFSNQIYDFDTLINYLVNSEFIKDTIYIDERDETNQIPSDKKTKFDNANIKTRIIKSNLDEFYLYTKYSNSKLRFENHRGYYIVEINYNQLN